MSLSPADNDSDDDLEEEEEEEEGVSGLTAMLNKSRELLTVKKTVANQSRVVRAGAGLVVGRRTYYSSATLTRLAGSLLTVSLGDAVLVQPAQLRFQESQTFSPTATSTVHAFSNWRTLKT